MIIISIKYQGLLLMIEKVWLEAILITTIITTNKKDWKFLQKVI